MSKLANMPVCLGLNPNTMMIVIFISGFRNQDKSGVIQLFIRSWTGKTLDISISRKASVAQLKEHIQQQEGFPPDQQILVHAGKGVGRKNLGGAQSSKAEHWGRRAWASPWR